MTDLRNLVAAAVALALLLCVGGIVYLAAVPERAVPDVLVALSTGALGYLGGLLVPTTARHRRSGERGYGTVELAIGAVVLVILVLILVRLVT
jgi:hypothetical protein